VPFAIPKLKPVSEGTLALAGIWAGLLDAAAASFLLIIAVNAWAPPQDLPWKPLRLTDPVGLATGAKFARAADHPELCRKVLAGGLLEEAHAAFRQRGDCSTENTVRVRDGTAVPLSPAAPVITCQVALGYAFWSRHVVQPAAREELGQPVRAVEHYGSFSCRKVYGRSEGRLSQHAFANALDVAAFRTASGRRVSVAGDFRGDDAEGRFLRRVRDGACSWFRAVLSPDYNAAHADHFHLDHGGFRACR
jgi:hypothetical protein